MLKRALRWFVLWSSVPPLVGLYRALYYAVVRVALAIFRRYRGVLSIYICRGCAKGHITPGISDVDFAIFVAEEGPDRTAVQRAYRLMGKATAGLVDYYPNLVGSRAALQERWRSAPVWQYRYLEGRLTWQLLYGEDLLAELPPLSESQRRTAIYMEMVRWWLLFARQMFGAGNHRGDSILRNMICYKAVAELLNLEAELRTGEYRPWRGQALEAAGSPLAERLIRCERERFLTRDDDLPDETMRFLVGFFTELWARFEEEPFLKVDRGVAQSVTGAEPKREGDSVTLRSTAWHPDEVLRIQTVDPDNLPTVAELAAVVDRERSAPDPAYLFIRAGNVGFPITPVIPRDWHRGLLTPGTTPDVFLQLGEPAYWTDYTWWHLGEWRTNLQWENASPLKQRQLEDIRRGAEAGHVTHQLSPEAIEGAAHEPALQSA